MDAGKRRIAVIVTAVVIVIAVVWFIFYIRSINRNRTTRANQSSFTQVALATPAEVQISATPTTVLAIPLIGWRFEGFNGEKTIIRGVEYSWANFVNDNGMKLKAMCSSPNSPAPKVGDEYRWDKTTNILVPVVNNKYGDIQLFWYPTIQP
jgi:hypothetical protein